jgi:hypothetical protein
MTDHDRDMPAQDWVDTTAGGEGPARDAEPAPEGRRTSIGELGSAEITDINNDIASVEQSDLGGAGLGDERGPGSGLGATRGGSPGTGSGVRSVQ